MELALKVLVNIFAIKNLILMLAGTTFGMMMGALPGLTATMAVALLVPFTFTMEPVSGLITLGAIYGGAIYGGCFSAILVNTPGTPSSIGTTFDGFPMAKKGEGDRAITIATIASAFGGIIGVLVLIFLSPPLAKASLKFGPPEYFWVSIFGLTIIASLASKSIIKGIVGGIFGLLVSTIGIAPIGGDVRFTFGLSSFQGGVQLIVALIGFFCIPELIKMVGDGAQSMHAMEVKTRKGVFGRTFREVFKMPGNLIRSSIIGTIVGIIPGAGGNIANLVSYNEAKRASKDQEKFGTGCMEGIVATEAANNATVGSGMVPLVTLGIPGAPPAAIILGALMLQGLRPGPELFSTHADITYTFMFSMLIANIMMVGVGVLGGRGLHKVVSKLPVRFLAPSIFFLTILGSYAIRNNIVDVFVMLGCGVIGYILRELGFHPGPILLGLILGSIAEQGLVQSMLMSMGRANRWSIFFTRPISLILIVMCLVSAIWPLIKEMRERKIGKEAAK